MGLGYLTITVHTADDALPIANAKVRIKSNGGQILYETITNENGYTPVFALTAPDGELSLDKYYTAPAYSTCEVEIEKEGYLRVDVHGVQIMDTETSDLPVEMHPLSEGGENHEDIYIPEIGLLLDTPRTPNGTGVEAASDNFENARNAQNEFNMQDTENSAVPVAVAQPRPFTLGGVLIPEYITVHLGAPTNSAARNVRVRFPDYVKNVASSEIYPTWPYNSLVSNIHAITTFALNRVFTEWYRSRGFNFDITNSTAYDQYFVEGRNVYENISNIVDGIFNVYAHRYGFLNPFFTSFCNGTTVTCNGLSQWGTVDLANIGYSPLQILRYYYRSDIQLAVSDNIGAITESYPGYALRIGSSGEPVRRIQNMLNRIRVNFPLIPQIFPDGVFGASTQAAVSTFQRTFNLTSDGIVGRSTWNKISFIYVGVIRLAELDSEGIRIGIGRTPPTVTVSQGSRGENVLQLQFILNAIAPYYDSVPPVIKDGNFDTETKNGVVQFQKTFGLTADGIVGPATWSKLYAVYWGIYDNVQIPEQPAPETDTAPQFPGTSLRVGSSGPDVRLMQTYLNVIRTVYYAIPQLVVDGMFGDATRNAVIAFQNQFLLTPDGIIGPITWNKIVEQYLLVTGGASVSTEFPGTLLRLGSTGASVRLMQTFLTELRSFYPSIPAIGTIDGVFGPLTQAAVIAFQSIFGLTPDGIVGPLTWDAIVAERNRRLG